MNEDERSLGKRGRCKMCLEVWQGGEDHPSGSQPLLDVTPRQKWVFVEKGIIEDIVVQAG